MSLKRDNIDDVLDRFEHHNYTEEELYSQRKNILSREFDADVEHDPIELETVRDRQQLLWFGLTSDQKQELNIAFRVVSNNRETISASKVFDLLQAIGLTLLPGQIKSLLSICLKDKNGQYNYPNLEAAINKFVANLVSVRILRGLFEFLRQNGELPCSIEDIESERMLRMQRVTALKMRDMDHYRRQQRRSRRYTMKNVVTSLLSLDSAPQSSEGEYTDGIKWEEVSSFLNGIMNTLNEENELCKEDICDVIGEISTRRDDHLTLFDFMNLFRAG